jgi:hypothetical protein
MERPDFPHTATERRIGREPQGGASCRGHTSARIVSPIPLRIFLSKCFSTLVGQLIPSSTGVEPLTLVYPARYIEPCATYRSMQGIRKRPVANQ